MRHATHLLVTVGLCLSSVACLNKHANFTPEQNLSLTAHQSLATLATLNKAMVAEVSTLSTAHVPGVTDDIVRELFTYNRAVDRAVTDSITALDGNGTAAEKTAAVLKVLGGIKQLPTPVQSFASSAANQQAAAGLVNTLTNIVNLVNSLINNGVHAQAATAWLADRRAA